MLKIKRALEKPWFEKKKKRKYRKKEKNDTFQGDIEKALCGWGEQNKLQVQTKDARAEDVPVYFRLFQLFNWKALKMLT